MGSLERSGASHLEGGRTMNTPTGSLISILVDAMGEGDAAPPLVLLDALRAESNPLAAYSSRFGVDAVNQAVEATFPAAQWLWHAGAGPVPEDVRTIYVGRLRWLRSMLPSWNKSSDESRSVFACLLITARMCGGQSSLWDALPGSFHPSEEFLGEAARILTNYRIDYSGPVFGSAPIWEGEFVQQFEALDEAGQWDEVALAWPRMAGAARPNLYLGELARCLAGYDMGALARTADAQPKVPAVMLMARCLSVSQKLRLAALCTSKRAIFCLVLSALDEAARRETLSGEVHEAFVALLRRAMNDDSEWRLWVGAFNRYPVRRPVIQAPLGEALASAPLHAIESYVDSISLSSIPTNIVSAREGRRQVGVCLRTFATHAPPERRQAMWRHAFNRWSEWRECKVSHPHGHFDVQWSELDYAVASYAAECISAEERERAMSDIRHELGHLEEVWHDSITDYITRVNVLLSLLQPYAHAEKVQPGGDMLVTQQIYWPFDFHGQPYLRQLFHVKQALESPPVT